jgi:hypothetical protein
MKTLTAAATAMAVKKIVDCGLRSANRRGAVTA